MCNVRKVGIRHLCASFGDSELRDMPWCNYYDSDLQLLCQDTHASYRELDSITCVISILITPVITPVLHGEAGKFCYSNAQQVGGSH